MYLKRFKQPFIVLVVLATLAGGWVYWMNRYLDSLEPQGPLLVDVLDCQPIIDSIRVWEVKGQKYLGIICQWRIFPKSPYVWCGPPIYVCDSQGLLLVWTHDSGDDNQFWQKCPEGIYQGKEISHEEMKLWPKSSR